MTKIITLAIMGFVSFVCSRALLSCFFLPLDTRQDCERRIEALLYSLPNHHVSLDRFMVEYERKFGKKLASYFEHPKLISLLEDMTESLLEVCARVYVCV